MFRLICIFLLFFFSVTYSHAVGVKATAVVGNTVISNQDVYNYQALMQTIGVKEQLSYSKALEQMIDLEIYYQYAKKVGIQLSQQKYDAALKQLEEMGIQESLITPLLKEYLKKQIFFSEIVEHLIRPRIYIDKNDVDSIKRDLLKNKNTFKLRKINSDDSEQDLGWIRLNELDASIREVVSQLGIGKTSEKIRGSRFHVSDKENDFILSVDFSGVASTKSDVIGTREQKLYSGRLSELKSTDRKNLFLSENGVKVQKNKFVFVLTVDSEKLHTRLFEIIYPKKLEKEVNTLSSTLREGLNIIRYQIE